MLSSQFRLNKSLEALGVKRHQNLEHYIDFCIKWTVTSPISNFILTLNLKNGLPQIKTYEEFENENNFVQK